MYWLLACATSEVYGDCSSDGTIADTSSFPLGFTTDDTDVDTVLTFIRMKQILELPYQQDQINDCIARLQARIVETAKPLKASRKG